MYVVSIFALMVVGCDGARVLAMIITPATSHWIVMEPLLKELAARGHQVTVYSSFPQKKPMPNYTDVDFSDRITPLISAWPLDVLRKGLPNAWSTVTFINGYHEKCCAIFEEPEFKKLMKLEDNYDLLITEVFGTDCFAYFASRLQIPLISFMTSKALPWAAERVGLPDNPSYIPNYLVDFSPDMSFWQRVYNSITLAYAKYCYYFVYNKRIQAATESVFASTLPPVEEVVANTSLLLVNSHYTFSQSRPFPPNVVEVGGIHIKEKEPLPKDLKDVMDNAKNGVIIMTFGSVVRTSTISKPVIKMFLEVFSKIQQTVIFKYEDDLPEAPPNVVTRNWLPQRDLIDHEKVLAVITHGGLASIIESVNFAKPIIGIPFFADQFANVKSVVRRGGGIQLEFDEISKENFASAVSEIVNNWKYTENMRRLSRQFRDRPMTALQTAVYWTEYVIRHQGAPHLRPASVSLPLYQYLLLDVIALLLISLVIAVYLVYFLVRSLLSMLKRPKVQTKAPNYKKDR